MSFTAPQALVTMKYPQHRFSSCCYKMSAALALFDAPIKLFGQQAVQDKLVLLVCRFQWNGPEKRPQGSCLRTSFPYHVSPRQSQAPLP